MTSSHQILAKKAAFLALTLNLFACASTGIERLTLMPPPLIYTNTATQHLIANTAPTNAPYEGVLYVTDRAPIALQDRRRPLQAYSKERHAFLSAGLNSLSLNQHGKNQLSISKVETFGVLKSVLPFGRLTNAQDLNQAKSGHERFLKLIEQKLAVSAQKDIFIYVHGAHNSFDSPPLVAGELWHYLGYEGVMVNFLWPASTARFAYFKDTESAQISGHNLGKIIEYLAINTSAEKIHLLSHSAGGRVVVTALRKLAIAGNSVDGKIGNAVLVASDLNPALFGIAIADGIADLPSSLTVYISPKDSALNFSSFLFKELRLGQVGETQKLEPAVVSMMDENNIDVIDVSGAPEISALHGHSYFRSSPWVSSDVISSLRFGLRPWQRSLNREAGQISWQFPKTYQKDIENLPLLLLN